MVNAVCPLVTKVHHEAKVRAGKGFTVLYVGHRGHDEASGTLAVAPESIRLVEHEDDLDDVLPTVDDPSKVALLAQTTLSMHDWQGIADRARDAFPELWTATRNDLCFATTNRQAALQAIAERGRRHRGDRQRELVEHARAGQGRARRPAARPCCASTVPTSSTPTRSATPRVVGVTAGASAPEDLVQAVIDRLAPTDGVEPVHVTDEDEYFPPPRELRELMAALDLVAPVLLGGSAPTVAGRRVHRRPPGRRLGRARRLTSPTARAVSGPALGVVEAALQLRLELLGQLGRGRAAGPALEHRRRDRAARPTPRPGAMRGSTLPFGRMCSLPPMPTGHDRARRA